LRECINGPLIGGRGVPDVTPICHAFLGLFEMLARGRFPALAVPAHEDAQKLDVAKKRSIAATLSSAMSCQAVPLMRHHSRHSAGERPVDGAIRSELCGFAELDITCIANAFDPGCELDRAGVVFPEDDGGRSAHQAASFDDAGRGALNSAAGNLSKMSSSIWKSTRLAEPFFFMRAGRSRAHS
jgi:hypothetical protein